jgi:serine/threonine protein kinase
MMQDPLVPSQLLNQRYRLLSQVGIGGFGAVYKAADTHFGDRLVAIKEISLRGLTPQEAIEATDTFNREVSLLSGLDHPNLPHIYDHFTDPEHWYLVMDFIEGETLEEVLQKNHLPAAPSPFTLEEILDMGIQLCTVLDYLHTRQPPIIFRDLKPANIMHTPTGQLYLIDFGIARRFTPGQAKDTMPFGSPGYAAPEQYGKAQTTPRADVYSLGATLHHVLSAHDPSETPFRFLPLQSHEQPVPAALEALITCMLDVNESNRPANMVIVKRSLQHIVLEHSETRHVHAFPADLPAAVHQPIPTPANRRPILSSLIIGLVMLVVVGSLSFRAITVLYHPVVSSPGHPPVNSAPPSQIVPTQTVLTPAKLIHRPIVCVATYQVIRALRTSDGSQLWRYSTGHSIEGPAMVMQGDTLYAVSVDGHLYALQITTGKLLWQQLVGATPNFPADVGGGSLRIMAGDTVVAIGYDMRVPRKAVVYVFKAQNGAPLWHDQAQAFDQGRSLVGVDDTAVYITDTSLQGGSSVTLARLAMNGTLLWTSPHFIAPAAWAGTPSLVIVNGVLYGYGNDLLAIHAQNGQLLWEQKVSQDGFPAQITTGNNEVYLVTQHRSLLKKSSPSSAVKRDVSRSDH